MALQRQPVLKDRRGHRIPRIPLSAAFQAEVEQAIQHTSRKFNVSRSFVIAVACADYFGIDIIRYSTKKGS
jgi:hypothetical protein